MSELKDATDLIDVSPSEFFGALCSTIAGVPVHAQVLQETQHTLILAIDAPAEHRGRIIGKHGRMIEALRTIARSLGDGTQRIVLEVKEDAQEKAWAAEAAAWTEAWTATEPPVVLG